jgi:predicted RNase H-like nuclease (RuvC/YqgF family)
MKQRIYSSRNTFGCPQCERYKEASFRDAIEFSKFRTMLQIADDQLTSLRAENERWNDLAQHNREAADHLEAENESMRERVSEAENRQGLAEIENERLRSLLDELAEAVPIIGSLSTASDDLVQRVRAALQSEDSPGSATYNQRWKSKGE